MPIPHTKFFFILCRNDCFRKHNNVSFSFAFILQKEKKKIRKWKINALFGRLDNWDKMKMGSFAKMMNSSLIGSVSNGKEIQPNLISV